MTFVHPRRPIVRETLEAIDDVATVRRKHSAFHQPRQPSALCVIDPANLMLGAWAIANQVDAHGRRCGESCHVFVSSALQAFVMLESRPAARSWLREHFNWYLGLYRRRTQFTNQSMALTLNLSPELILDDLKCHLIDLAAHEARP